MQIPNNNLNHTAFQAKLIDKTCKINDLVNVKGLFSRTTENYPNLTLLYDKDPMFNFERFSLFDEKENILATITCDFLENRRFPVSFSDKVTILKSILSILKIKADFLKSVSDAKKQFADYQINITPLIDRLTLKKNNEIIEAATNGNITVIGKHPENSTAFDLLDNFK